MKYSILGFNQSKVTDTELDLTDLVILQYIQQACGVANMKHIMDENDNPMVWICHAKLSEDLPILRLSEGSLKNRLSKLKRNGYLESITSANEKGRGVRVYYRITELTTSFIYDMEITTSQNNDVKTPTTSQNNDMETERPRHLKVTSDNILNTSDNSLLNDNQLTLILGENETKYSDDFEQFWKAYPKHADKRAAYNVYQKWIKKGITPLTLLTSAQNYADQCKRNRTEEKYIKHGSTFLSLSDKHFLEYINKKTEPAVNNAQANALRQLEKIKQAKIAGGN